jgi:hypothetical protein
MTSQALVEEIMALSTILNSARVMIVCDDRGWLPCSGWFSSFKFCDCPELLQASNLFSLAQFIVSSPRPSSSRNHSLLISTRYPTKVLALPASLSSNHIQP